jgi:hypothetical protein
MVPAGQVTTQPVGPQSSPEPQAFAHMPQLPRSVVRSTQTPPHRVRPAGQAHWLFSQMVPPVHVFPQVPQLLGSFRKFTQLPPHEVRFP